MLCICSHLLWHVVQLNGGHEIADSAGWLAWCAGWRLVAGVKHDERICGKGNQLALDDKTLMLRNVLWRLDKTVVILRYRVTSRIPGDVWLLSRFYHIS